MRTGPRRSERNRRSSCDTPLDTAARDAELLQQLEKSFGRSADQAGDHLVCAPGCSDCCHGPFPVTPLDVSRLRRGLAALARRDAERARALGRRARAAVAVLTPGFPGEPRRGSLDANVQALDRFFERHATLACPALDAAGRCELYEHRPVSCREYGPPLRYGDERAAPCPLCFTKASPQEIERCRYTPDPDGLEEAILARLVEAADGEPGGDWQTLIAFALANPG